MTELQERQKESLEQARVWYAEGLADGCKEKSELIEKIKSKLKANLCKCNNIDGECELCFKMDELLDTFKQAEKIE